MLFRREAMIAAGMMLMLIGCSQCKPCGGYGPWRWDEESIDTLSDRCSPLFTPVGDSCLLFASTERLTWSDARTYCQGLSADLAVIEDANHYLQIVNYVNEVNSKNESINIWLGGTDAGQEGTWEWVTGELMPLGTSFWGKRNNYLSEPSGGVIENCAAMYQGDNYYVHDFQCGITNLFPSAPHGWMVPLCQQMIENP